MSRKAPLPKNLKIRAASEEQGRKKPRAEKMSWQVKRISDNEYLVTTKDGYLPPVEVAVYTLFGPSVFCNTAEPGEGYILQLHFTFKGYVTVLTDNLSFIYLLKGNKYRELYENFQLPKAILT